MIQLIVNSKKTFLFDFYAKSLIVSLLFFSCWVTLNGQLIFDYTGGPLQQYTIPNGVNSMSIEVVGADGGSIMDATPIYGGEGATAFGVFSVTPGDVLELRIGAAGANATDPYIGENGVGVLRIAPGGGDATAVFFMDDPLIIAGGGGGSGGLASGFGGSQNTWGVRAGVDPQSPVNPGGVDGLGGAGGGWISDNDADGLGGGGGGGYLGVGEDADGGFIILDLPSVVPGLGGDILKGGGGGYGVDNGYGGGGGGGGYSGGGGASGSGGYFYPLGIANGGGGGSFVNSTATNATTNMGSTGGANGNNGQVIIHLNCTPPVVNVTGSYNINTDPGLCTAIIPDVGPLFSLVSASGTPAPVITLDFNPNTPFPVGLSTVPVSATNTCGTNQATIDINVTDAELPTAVCKDINIEVSDVFTTILASDIDGGSSDACGVALRLVNGLQGGNAINSLTEGLQLVNLTVIDVNGNTASCDAEVTVVKDLCQAGDDGMDSDGGGLPDACDCSPDDAFNDNIILRNNENVGMDFDGVDDYLSIPNAPALIPTNNNSMTFEAWINPEEVSGFQAIATSANVGTLSTYHFAINLQNDKVRVITLTSSLVVSNASIPANAWTHIAVVFTAHPTTPSLSTTEIYVNGVSDNLVTGSFQAGNFGYPVILGNIDEFNLPYNGSLEEVRFWSSARTAAEIQLLKDRELSGMEADLEAYYNFGDGIPGGDNTNLTFVKDYSDNAFDASLSGFDQMGESSNWVNAIEGLQLEVFHRDTLSPCINCPQVLDVCMDFDGVDDRILIPRDTDLFPTNSNSVTFETWIYPENVIDTGMILSSGNFPYINFQVFISSSKINITGLEVGPLISNANIQVNEWTHIAVVFDKTETKLFINGVLDNTRPQSLSSTILPNYALSLGAQESGMPTSWSFDGRMDEIRFWNDARTENEVLNNMNEQLQGDEGGLLGYYNFSDGVPGADNNTGLYSSVSDMSTFSRNLTAIGIAATGTSSNWVSASPLPESPQINAALHFDGVDDHLTILNQPNLIATNTQSVTFEAWIYPEKETGVSMVYATGIFPDVKNQVFLSDDKINITGAGLSGMVSNASIPSFEWSHIAVVFDKTETRLYVNGKLDQTRTGTLTSDNMGFNISLGNQENGLPANWNFLGKMDDVRMWGTARSESQIFDDLFSERTGLEDDLGAYFNFNNGIPEGDNSTITSAPDITGNGGGAVLNGFAKMGSISNFVSSPHRFIDFDVDGIPDYCDSCIAPKELILENLALDGTYQALESITLGEGLYIDPNAILTIKAPNILIPMNVDFPLSAIINLIPVSGCEE